MSGVQVVIVVLMAVCVAECVVLAVFWVDLAKSMKELRQSSQDVRRKAAELQTMTDAPARRSDAMSRSRSDSGVKS